MTKKKRHVFRPDTDCLEDRLVLSSASSTTVALAPGFPVFGKIMTAYKTFETNFFNDVNGKSGTDTTAALVAAAKKKKTGGGTKAGKTGDAAYHKIVLENMVQLTTDITNILKTNHDSAKAAINNIHAGQFGNYMASCM